MTQKKVDMRGAAVMESHHMLEICGKGYLKSMQKVLLAM